MTFQPEGIYVENCNRGVSATGGRHTLRVGEDVDLTATDVTRAA